MEHIEHITWEGRALAYLIRAGISPDKTSFPTPSDLNLQIGFVVYPAGGVIARHVHVPLERHIVGTCEVLFVKKGRCEIDVYNDNRELVATRELVAGDTILIAGGGHGLRMLEDTILQEIKQGPYTGVDEKERF